MNKNVYYLFNIYIYLQYLHLKCMHGLFTVWKSLCNNTINERVRITSHHTCQIEWNDFIKKEKKMTLTEELAEQFPEAATCSTWFLAMLQSYHRNNMHWMIGSKQLNKNEISHSKILRCVMIEINEQREDRKWMMRSKIIRMAIIEAD